MMVFARFEQSFLHRGASQEIPDREDLYIRIYR